jgi:hypothetical protein
MPSNGAAVALLSGRFGHEPVLTAKSSPVNALAAPPSLAATAQIVAAYTAFFSALTAAEPQSQARAAAILAPYATQPYMRHVLTQMTWYRANDEVSWGYVIPHVTNVQTTGGRGPPEADHRKPANAAARPSPASPPSRPDPRTATRTTTKNHQHARRQPEPASAPAITPEDAPGLPDSQNVRPKREQGPH